MIDCTISLPESYVLINKVLNTLVRRKFGKQYSIRLNSLRFISNRTDIFYLHTCSEKIIVKTIKPVSFNELILIKGFLIFNINNALMCIDNSSCIKVVDVEIIIL
jgi:hypothetical protein